ncbi:MAG: hypothetical protein JRH06_09010 [Deltaproteobacteria bacterium]|nr:hypothetical protein [Deltaproteobacteria bacterium]MBW2137683.1 hypothetical protein [Deltaproteobacteria bacterium]
MGKIKISAGDVVVQARLYDNPTADAIRDRLPIEGRANRWGDEIYFGIPVAVEEAPDANDVVEMGELGYWPPGSAFCIFFGPTPASRGEEIRAASPVNRFGRVEGDPSVLKAVKSGEKVTVEKVQEG